MPFKLDLKVTQHPELSGEYKEGATKPMFISLKKG